MSGGFDPGASLMRLPDTRAACPTPNRQAPAPRRRAHRLSLILARVERLIGFDIRVALAVSVGVPDERGPACDFISSCVSSNIFVLSQPITCPPLVHNVVRVLGEHQVMRPKQVLMCVSFFVAGSHTG